MIVSPDNCKLAINEPQVMYLPLSIVVSWISTLIEDMYAQTPEEIQDHKI